MTKDLIIDREWIKKDIKMLLDPTVSSTVKRRIISNLNDDSKKATILKELINLK